MDALQSNHPGLRREKQTSPRRVLKDDALYFADNGRVTCGACAGMSAAYTGRDISGQRVQRITSQLRAECIHQGFDPACEDCGKKVAS